MSVRFGWMHTPRVEYVQEGFDVSADAYLPESEWSEETTVDGGSALLISADEVTVVTGTDDDLAEWAVEALWVNTGVDLYEKCAICHLFVELNCAFDAAPGRTARYMHLCNDDYPDDEALDASHEPHPSGVRLPLAVWKKYGPAHMLARFERAKEENA